jgi:hypothetical protein
MLIDVMVYVELKIVSIKRATSKLLPFLSLSLSLSEYLLPFHPQPWSFTSTSMTRILYFYLVKPEDAMSHHPRLR